MRNQIRTLFQYLALLGRVVGVFPLMIILSYVSINTYDPHLFWIELIGLIAVTLIGYAQMELISRIESKQVKWGWIAKVIGALMYIVEIVAIWVSVIYFLPAPGMIKAEVVAAYTILFFLSVASYEVHYTRIWSAEVAAFSTGIYVVAIALCHDSVLGIMYLMIIADYLFLNNQSRLEALLESTQENTPMFRNIRRDNMKWVCLIMSLLFIGYPIRKQIGQILSWIGIKVLTVVGFIIGIVVKLISMLFVTQQATDETVQPQEMGKLPAAESNQLVDHIFWIIVIGMTAFLVIRYRENIVKALIAQRERAKVLLKKIYKFLFKKKKRKTETESYYTDTVEELSQAMIDALQRPEKMSERNWKRQVKKYLKLSDEEKIYRQGYKLLLQGVSMRGIQIKASLTPREIMQRVEKDLTRVPIEKETLLYEKIRYNDEIEESQQVQEIKKILKELLELN